MSTARPASWRAYRAGVLVAAAALAMVSPVARGGMLDGGQLAWGQLAGFLPGGGGVARPAARPATPPARVSGRPGASAGPVAPPLALPRDMATAVRLAREVRHTYGVPVSVTLGQAMHESRADLSSGLARQGRNYFGVKCTANNGPFAAGCIAMDTVDYAPDRGLYLNPGAGFRRYNSPRASFRDYGRVLSLPAYAAAHRCGGEPGCFLRAVEAGGYASPGYAGRVLGVIRAHGLTRWDR